MKNDQYSTFVDSNLPEQIAQVWNELTNAKIEIKRLSEEVAALREEISQISANDFPVTLPESI
ncbi:MAG: hypothetical protein MST10_07020 [Lentisphaeria bacterium]|nr:hypothetical protein [Lentisphaeria bacterium]